MANRLNCLMFLFLVSVETHGEEAPLLEEMIVTAERVESNVQDTAIAVTAISDSTIRDFGMVGPDDIGVLVPSFSRTLFDVTLRGIGRNFRTLGGDPGVASYYNGVYSENVMIGATENRLYDVQRIEVLRGPQGTLYGRNAIGGVVNFITNPPTDEPMAEVFARFDQHGTKEVDGVVSGPIGDKLKVRLMGAYTDLGADRESKAVPGQDPVDDTGDGHEGNVALTIDFLPWRNLDIRLRGNVRDTRYGQRAPLHIGEGDGDRSVRSNARCFPDGTDCFVEPSFDGSFLSRLNSNAHAAVPINGNGYGKDLKNEAYPDYDPEGTLESSSITADVRWYFGYDRFTLRYLGGYNDSDYRLDWGLEPPGGLNRCNPPDCSQGSDQQVREARSVAVEKFWNYSNELQLISNFDGRWNFLAGLYQYKADHVQEFAFQDSEHLGSFVVDPSYGLLGDDPFGPPLSRGWHENAVNEPTIIGSWGGDPDGTYFSFIADSLTTSRALYGQLYFDLSEKFRLTLGGRYSYDEKEGSDRRFGYFEFLDPEFGLTLEELNFLLTTDPETFAPNGEPQRLVGIPVSFQDGVELEDDWDRFTWRVNLDWRPNDHSLGYFSIATGYRSGGFNLGLNQSFSFDEESVVSYELGYKTEILDRSLRLNTAVYFYDYEDHQVRAVAPVDDPFDPGATIQLDAVQNISEATNWGVEVESVWRATTALMFGGLYSYMKTEIQSDFYVAQQGNLWSSSNDPEPLNVKGNSLNRSPAHKFTIWGSYTWPLGRNGHLEFLSSLSYTDEQYQDVINIDINRTPAFSRWDARLNWDSATGRFRASLFGVNLGNELGIRELFAERNLARMADTVAPRTIGVEFRMRFGAFGTNTDMDRSSNLPRN